MIMMAAAPPESQPKASGGTLDFAWIEDEGLLRDEGVLFGLSRDEAGLNAKEECIRAYYRLLKAEGERTLEGLADEIAALNPAPADRTTAGSDHAAAASGSAESPMALAVRYGLAIAAAAAACAGTGALVYAQLRPVMDASAVVTVGVLAAGFFTASLPVPLLFVSDRAERPGAVELWKVRVAEIGLPLAAALFVVAWAWERLGPLRSVATFALLVLVFAFAGRQLLSSVAYLGRALRALRAERAAAALRKVEEETALRAAAGAERVAELRREKAALRSNDEWDAICDARIALFRSEFELASASAAYRGRVVPQSPVSSTNGAR